MNVTVLPSAAYGTVSAPPSKSMAHRLLICAALSDGVSNVRGLSFSEDVLATVDCLRKLGAVIERNGNDLTVTGIDLFRRTLTEPLDCSESGSTLRFLIPLCLLTQNGGTLTGSRMLLSRPLSVYEELFSQKSIEFQKSNDSVQVRGTLFPGLYPVRGNVSSQFISGLLFALPLLPGDSAVRIVPPAESIHYLDMTIEALGFFGVRVIRSGNEIFVPGNQQYRAADVTVEGDWSNAAFLEALNLTGGNVTVTGLDEQSLQGDRVFRSLFDRLKSGFCRIDLSNCPDLGPILFTAASLLHGAVFTGTERLRGKESDRVRSMAEELKKCGITLEIGQNSVTVPDAVPVSPALPLDGYNDHRIVMALTVLLTKLGGTICGTEAVKKSYPDFFKSLDSLHVRTERDEV